MTPSHYSVDAETKQLVEALATGYNLPKTAIVQIAINRDPAATAKIVGPVIQQSCGKKLLVGPERIRGAIFALASGAQIDDDEIARVEDRLRGPAFAWPDHYSPVRICSPKYLTLAAKKRRGEVIDALADGHPILGDARSYWAGIEQYPCQQRSIRCDREKLLLLYCELPKLEQLHQIQVRKAHLHRLVWAMSHAPSAWGPGGWLPGATPLNGWLQVEGQRVYLAPEERRPTVVTEPPAEADTLYL